MTVYQRDPDSLPDSAFERGQLHHLVPGSAGRLLDPRRTPIRLGPLRWRDGMFAVDICGFEDTGARWWLPFERVADFQLARGAPRLPASEVKRLQATIDRLDQPLELSSPDGARARTEARIADARRALGSLPPPCLDAEEAQPELVAALSAWMATRGVGDTEAELARTWVSNPASGEMVRAHRICMARLGICPFMGRALRDPAVLDAARREAHIIARLAFVRELFSGASALPLYRGMTLSRPISPPDNRTLLSSTLSRAVAESWMGFPGLAAVLMRANISPERVWMTHLETAEMSRVFREAEVVLFWAPGVVAF